MRIVGEISLFHQRLPHGMAEKVFNGNILCVKGVNPVNMPVRASLWTLLMAFFGFLFFGRGLPVVNNATIGGAFLGAFVGLFLAIMFERRAKRKRA